MTNELPFEMLINYVLGSLSDKDYFMVRKVLRTDLATAQIVIGIERVVQENGFKTQNEVENWYQELRLNTDLKMAEVFEQENAFKMLLQDVKVLLEEQAELDPENTYEKASETVFSSGNSPLDTNTTKLYDHVLNALKSGYSKQLVQALGRSQRRSLLGYISKKMLPEVAKELNQPATSIDRTSLIKEINFYLTESNQLADYNLKVAVKKLFHRLLAE